MVGGYENVIALPTMGVFDTSMMQADIAAAREIYNQARDDYKEFQKKYEDFVSPILEDNNTYYNLTIGGARDMLDDMSKNGIDPLRSQEGRTRLQQFIRTRPTGLLNTIKQNALDKSMYDKLKAESIASGNTTEDFANWELQNAGMDGFQTVSIDPTTGQTITRKWNLPAPGKFQTIENALLPTIQELQQAYRFNPEKSKVSGGYDIYDVSPEQVSDAINQQYGDLMQSPAMRYHLEKSGLSEDQFKDMLKDQVMSQMPEKREVNQYTLERIKDANDMKRMERSAWLNYYYDTLKNQDKEERKSNNGQSGEYSHFLQISDATSGNIDDHLEKLMSKNTSITIGKNSDGTNINAQIFKFKDGNGNSKNIYVVPDKNGPIKGTKGNYRLLTDMEKQAALLNSLRLDKYEKNIVTGTYHSEGMPTLKSESGYNLAWRKIAIKDQYSTMKDFVKYASINQQSNDGEETFRQTDQTKLGIAYNKALVDDLYDVDYVMSRAYGINLHSGQKFSTSDMNKLDVSKGLYMDYKGYAADIIDGTTGHKNKYVEVVITDGTNECKKLLKVGEYGMDSDGMWYPTNKWASRMMPGDRNTSKNIVGAKDSVELINVE